MAKKDNQNQSDKETVPQVQSVQRALDILDYLAEHGPTGLQQLHVGTGISKGALRRLLATLAARRFIWVGITDGMYRTNVSAPKATSQDIARVGHLVDVARPHMIAMTEKIRWASALHLYNHDRMCIIESTHGMTLYRHSATIPPNSELNVFAAASGLAVLASKGDDFALQLVDELKDDVLWSLSRFRISPTRLLDDLRDIRTKGYAVRRTSQGRFDNRNAIAVAIFDGKDAIGAVTLNWHRKLTSAESFAAQHLGALRAVAQAISQELTDSA